MYKLQQYVIQMNAVVLHKSGAVSPLWGSTKNSCCIYIKWPSKLNDNNIMRRLLPESTHSDNKFSTINTKNIRNNGK